jgi:endoglucanase
LKFTAVRAPGVTIVLIPYRSGDYKDELVWGAVWLYRATNDNSYLNTAEQLYNEFGLQNWNGGFTWDQKISGVEVS